MIEMLHASLSMERSMEVTGASVAVMRSMELEVDASVTAARSRKAANAAETSAINNLNHRLLAPAPPEFSGVSGGGILRHD